MRPTVLSLTALLLAGCSGADLLPPGLDRDVLPCAEPAPLTNQPQPGLEDSFLIVYREGVDPVAVTAALEAKYGFEATYVYQYVWPGFAARLPRATLNGLRCEPEVSRVSHDAWVGPAG
ncbi:MAG TPA: protease inhibitor I9 family protein [Longimicrobium sp.]|nr:protease inhibitor I9 family protein [Longimicrobium sp.]